MKAIYKSILFIFASVFVMVSCNNDDVLPPTGPLDNAEKLVVGTYVGEWTQSQLDTVTNTSVVVATAPGSITFSVDEENYGNNVAVMKLDVSGLDLGIDVKNTSVCNITRLSSGDLTYWNNTAKNPFGTTFYGKVDTDGVATMEYSTYIVVKRRETAFNFYFTGKKE